MNKGGLGSGGLNRCCCPVLLMTRNKMDTASGGAPYLLTSWQQSNQNGMPRYLLARLPL